MLSLHDYIKTFEETQKYVVEATERVAFAYIDLDWFRLNLGSTSGIDSLLVSLRVMIVKSELS